MRGGRVLLALPLLDELSGGLSVASAPTLSNAIGSGVVALTAALLVAPMLSSFLEAPVLAWTDRWREKRHLFVAAGVAGMALSVVLVSFVGGVVGLALATGLYGPMSGIALGTGEAMLVDGVEERTAAQRLARWSLFASVGDVLAPALLVVAEIATIPWRASFRVAGGALFVVALLLGVCATADPRAPENARDDEDAHENVFVALRTALTNRRLFVWLLGAALCTLLDELLAVLAAIWVSEKFSPSLAAPTLVAFSLGGVIGAAILERALARWSKRAAVSVSSIACVAAIVAWLCADTWPVAIAWCFSLGVATAPLHPLAKAEAFATLPSRPGLVNGAAQAFVVIDLVAPVVFAWIADAYGARTALALLALQPIALLAMAIAWKKEGTD